MADGFDTPITRDGDALVGPFRAPRQRPTPCKVAGWRVRASKGSYLNKVLGSAKGVVVPHNLVKATGDIMLISKQAVPAYSGEEE